MDTKATIIAECCQNHNGDKNILKLMIHEAAKSGADYCKIQAIRSRELVKRERFEQGLQNKDGETTCIQRPFKAEFERLAKLDLDLETEQWFVDECLRTGIAPMITIFTQENIQEVKDMGFEAVKIASYDCASFPLLRKVRKYWPNIFVSTGATTDSEINQAAKILKGTNYSFLHCVTIYPTPLEELNLYRINYLKKHTGNVGFSDHTHIEKTGLQASKMAMAMGATCIERHFTVLEPSETRDGPVSVNPNQLKELVDFAKLNRFEMMELVKSEIPEWDKSLGSRIRDLSHDELLNRDYYRGRFATMLSGKPVYNWEEAIL